MKYCLLFILPFWFSCTSKPADEQQTRQEIAVNATEFTVEPAPEWTHLFLRKSGWFGGDGIYAIPFSGKDAEPGDSLLFVFSDTMIGEIAGGQLKPGSVMVNNSVAVLKGNTPDSTLIAFKTARTKEGYKAVFAPKTGQPDPNTYFWLGDGFVNPDANQDLFLFAYKMTNTHDQSGFPFKETGNTLIRVPRNSRFPYTDHQQIDLPFNHYTPGEETISFGAGIVNRAPSAGEAEPDGFVYVYGIQGANKKLVAARVKPDRIASFDQWRFWDGTTWSDDPKSVVALSDSVSNEMSVSRLSKGNYALVYQLSGIFPEICMQVGPSPVGPFGPRIILYRTTSDIKDKDLFTYNAKAHPALSAAGELLISYNVNSFKFFDVLKREPNLYRPRFIRVKFKPPSGSRK
ncbi:DUF4185 domain-containing protein [Larkinella bovis]|uniref:DUF4185 domain-containing protein n=1 Tax=Larkinella bovis TaxID=683041 RepID=A0ABW0IH06_9BACT